MGKYDDIINLPHHVSERHAHMPVGDRAAQFSPFAALTGHGAAIQETARLTETKIELSEDKKAILDMKLRMLSEIISDEPQIKVTYFVPDKLKEGGEYVTASGELKSINEYKKLLTLTDGTQIETDEIIEIESDLFLGVTD